MRRKGNSQMFWEIAILFLALMLGAGILLVATDIIGGGEIANAMLSQLSGLTAGMI